MSNYNTTGSTLSRVPNYINKDSSKANLSNFLGLKIISQIGNNKEKNGKDSENYVVNVTYVY